MDTTTARNRKHASAALALPKSAAAQLKHDAIDCNQPGAVPTPEVVHGTATTAIRASRTRRRVAPTRVVASAVRRIFASLLADSRPKPSYAARFPYLEDARMSREMDRL